MDVTLPQILPACAGVRVEVKAVVCPYTGSAMMVLCCHLLFDIALPYCLFWWPP